jgi:hypothetical protein
MTFKIGLWIAVMMALLVAGIATITQGKSDAVDWKQVQLQGQQTTVAGKMIRNDKGEHFFYLLLLEGKELLTFQVDEKLYFHTKIKSKAVLKNRDDGTRMIAGIVEE